MYHSCDLVVPHTRPQYPTPRNAGVAQQRLPYHTPSQYRASPVPHPMSVPHATSVPRFSSTARPSVPDIA
eukprot:367430-Rhodomonas_salina.2